MDAFYASVELLRRPELRSQPVAIGGSGNPFSRGVVTTANYEARKYGIRSAMPLRRAYELCPQCVFLPTDFDAYRAASRAFKAAIATVTTLIEDRGIDEVYLDLTPLAGDAADGGRDVAATIKQRVLQATGLTCSIGVAPNKLLAKIASDLDKPDGLTLIAPGDLQSKIWPLPVRRVNGIGPKADALLAQIGITTIGDLAQTDPVLLAEHFSVRYARWLLDAAHGRDERPLDYEQEPRSISRETTLSRDLDLKRDWQAVAALLVQLSRSVADDLQRKRYAGRTIGVKIRYDDFKVVSRDITLAQPSADPVAVRKAAFACLARVPASRRIRLLGVRIGSLEPWSEIASQGNNLQADADGQAASARSRNTTHDDAVSPGVEEPRPRYGATLPLFNDDDFQ